MSTLRNSLIISLVCFFATAGAVGSAEACGWSTQAPEAVRPSRRLGG
jgi:hypothetical protein